MSPNFHCKNVSAVGVFRVNPLRVGQTVARQPRGSGHEFIFQESAPFRF